MIRNSSGSQTHNTRSHPSGRRAAARVVGLLACLFAIPGSLALADDWPMYRHDPARSGITSETLEVPLAQSWVFQPHFPPRPAWGSPKAKPVEGYLELRRRHFDDVFHVAVVDDALFFGSSSDHKVYCLDAATGQVRWSRITGGPVRLAPTVVDQRVYVGSDDGYAYCFDAADGSDAQPRFRAAPEDQRVLGSGKMISLWPLRCGVLVDAGVAYLTAGVFPGEGVFLHARDAKTGEPIWQNGEGGETPQSRIAPQGYLLASKSNLYVPMGRVSPAVYDRNDGKLKRFTYFGKDVGGTYALLAGGDVFTGTEQMVGYRGETYDRFAAFTGRKLVVTEETAYVATETDLSALDRKRFPDASNKVKTLKARKVQLARTLRSDPTDELKAKAAELDDQIKEAEEAFAATTQWKTPCTCYESLILAGGTLFAGGNGQVIAVEADSGNITWTGKVDGTAKGLAVAGGRLWVSTDTGAIHAFAPKGSPRHGIVAPSVDKNPFARSPLSPMFQQAAETIQSHSEAKRGFCLVLGCETGQLALELARRTEMTIYVVDPRAEKVEAAQKAIDTAGLYGGRICVEKWPFDKIPYSDYFANLIVSETAMVTGNLPPAGDEILRMLKPLGGIALIGQPDRRAPNVQPLEAPTLKRWLDQADARGQLLTNNGTWAKIVRGPLPGAGKWTHLYANAANTACGDDQAVKSPFGVLWFGQPGPERMVNRHQRAAGPIAIDGRLFIQGENVIMAHDIYNGSELWKREMPGALRLNASHDGSNLTANDEGLFVAIGDHCVQLDPETGEEKKTFPFPPEAAGKGRWGYVATVGNRLFGSRTLRGRASDTLFSYDTQTGKHWSFQGKEIPHIAIGVGQGRVFFVDKNVTDQERQEAIADQRSRIAKLPESERAAALAALEKPDIRKIHALDAQTGQVVWQQAIDLTHCGGSELALMVGDGAVVVFGVYLDGHYWRQFFAGEFAARRVTVLSSDDGKFLWSQPVGFRVRPLIIGNTLHAEPWAFDLLTGQPRTRVHPVTQQVDQWQFARPGHHCGLPTASKNCLFFRSYNLGYYDLARDAGTMHFGGQRPGCWVNFVPAGGLLLFPESSAGCMCPFANMCSVVFKPTQKNKAFAYYSAPGPMTPVKRLGINLGAPGDRTDASGELWLGYPRPAGSLVLKFDLSVALHAGGGFDRRNSTYTPIASTERPWLFTSAMRGLRRCELPLLEEGDGTALYRVRLAFADPDNDQSGRRVFDIKLQDQVVLKDFDVAQQAGGRDRAVWKEFSGIEVTSKLRLEMIPKTPGKQKDTLPILQAIEVTREKMTSLGCATPDFLLSSLQPNQAGELKLTNLKDAPFEGTLEMAAPKGFKATAKTTQLSLASGARATIPIEVSVAQGVAPGDYQIGIKLVSKGGSVEAERFVRTEHLGKRGRLVIPASADAAVRQRYADRNQGTVASMFVDGGDRTMGDTAHTLSFLRFPLDVPGKVLEARLRIHNGGNPTANSGRVCLAEGEWAEKTVTYANRPKAGKELAQLGRVSEYQVVQRVLDVDLTGMTELNLVLDPTSCDGVDYLTRESDKKPELVIEYEPSK